MNKLKYFSVLAFTLVFLALATHSFGYQAENRISLMATPQHPGANGSAVIIVNGAPWNKPVIVSSVPEPVAYKDVR
jgi:hypothetical protein